MASRGRRGPDRPWRRIRALLTSGLVLGIGATMTMASWTGNEYATGSFTAGVFDFQGSTDGGATWADHSGSGTAATMSFSGAAMSPGSVQYAPFLIRTKPTSVGGTLVVQAGSSSNGPLGLALGLRVVLFTGTCAAASFTGSPTFLVGTSSTPAPIATIGAGVGMVANGAVNVAMCFEVSLPVGAANTLQGISTIISWQVSGSSN